MISVLLVEDSPVERALLISLLEADPEIHVIGCAENGVEALEFLTRQRPDVVAMDLSMPRMNGIEATRRIMETTPLPIVVVSGDWNVQGIASTSAAMEAGAVAGVRKPAGPGHPEYEELRVQLLQTIKTMAGIKVVRRWPRYRKEAAADPRPANERPTRRQMQLDPAHAQLPVRAVAIGVSTGGPPVLQAVLSVLPPRFPAPVLVVQHIARGFVNGLVEWLRKTTPLSIHVATHGEPAEPGHVYLAPDDFHMGLDRHQRIIVDGAPPENGFRPAVAYLFRSLVGSLGKETVAVLLTGMGRDGARELKLLHDAGAITIVQNEESCAVFGMPHEAIKLGAARYVLPPDRIGSALRTFVATPETMDGMTAAADGVPKW